ncbi:hypothetical protein BZA77DRAFT_295394 [Pyronema omphalodes]|nr:hypothetical protein BZA77DRAFT_295394 [Pyronema omphalodes]
MAPPKKPRKLAEKPAKSFNSAPTNAPVISGPNSATNHWPLQKYAFCMPNPDEPESWSHFPQRDNLDFVIQQHRPLDGFLAEIVIVKIIWSMQTLMEINITELLMRNTSVQILCRSPSLGVKYQSPSGCTHRFQVTFKSENDMETVKNRFQDMGCQVSESPVKSDSMLSNSHSQSQQPQQQSQQPQFQQPPITPQQWYGSSQTSGIVPTYSTPPASQQTTLDPFGNSHVQQLGMVTRALTDVLQLQQNQLHSQQQQVVQQQSQQHQYMIPQSKYSMPIPPTTNNPFNVAPQHTLDGMNIFGPTEHSDGPNSRFTPILELPQRVSTPSAVPFQRDPSYRGPTSAVHRDNTPLASSVQRESYHRSQSPTKNRYPSVHQARETASKARERRWKDIHAKLPGMMTGQFSVNGLPPQMPESEAIGLEDEVYKILADPEFMDMIEMMDQALGDKIRGDSEASSFSQPSSELNMMEELALEVLEDPRFPEIHRLINHMLFKRVET